MKLALWISAGKTRRVCVLALVIVLLICSLSVIGSVYAQSIPKPSIPEFTLQLDGDFLGVTIKNQPVIPNGHDTALIAYDFRYKWSESENWPTETVTTGGKFAKQTNVADTTRWYYSINTFYEKLGRTSSHQLDCQMRAISGYLNSSIMYSSPIGGVDPNSQPVIIVTASEWSDIQTITIPVNNPTTKPAPTPSPSLPTPISTSFPYQNPTLMPTQPGINSSALPSNWLETIVFTVFGVVVVLLLVLVVLLLRRVRVLEAKVNGN